MKIKPNDWYKNNKNGNIYRIIHVAIECTNSRDGETTIVYTLVSNSHLVFTRESQEFKEKFTLYTPE